MSKSDPYLIIKIGDKVLNVINYLNLVWRWIFWRLW